MPLWAKKNKTQKMHDAAVQAFESGDLQNALKGFANLCDLETQLRAVVLPGRATGHGSAARWFDQSFEMKRSRWIRPNSQALYSLSIVYAGQKNIEAAFDAVRRAYESDSTDFRILNHLATLMLDSPFADHQNPQKAAELAKTACELTGWQDEICESTYKRGAGADRQSE